LKAIFNIITKEMNVEILYFETVWIKWKKI